MATLPMKRPVGNQFPDIFQPSCPLVMNPVPQAMPYRPVDMKPKPLVDIKPKPRVNMNPEPRVDIEPKALIVGAPISKLGKKTKPSVTDSNKIAIGAVTAVVAVGGLAVEVGRAYSDCRGQMVTRRAERIHCQVDNQINSFREGLEEIDQQYEQQAAEDEEEIAKLKEEIRRMQAIPKSANRSQIGHSNSVMSVVLPVAVVMLVAFMGNPYTQHVGVQNANSVGTGMHMPSAQSHAATHGRMENAHVDREPSNGNGNNNPNDDPCQQANWFEGEKDPIKLPNGKTVPAEKRFALNSEDQRGTAPSQRMRDEMRSRGGLPTDDAGHLQAKKDGGSGSDPLNLAPQDSKLNRGAFREFEKEAAEWLSYLKKKFPGKKVQVRSSVKPFYRPGSGRPDFFSYTMYLCVDGQKTNVYDGKFDQHLDGVSSLMEMFGIDENDMM